MKVLLTGASGFVGSHILDQLRARGIPTAVLLRPDSNRRFIIGHMQFIEVCTGSISNPDSLADALKEVTHVIHCAGCTKARTSDEFYSVNQFGTRNVINAVNTRPDQIKRLLHISSLAVSGPATAAQPAREDGPLSPVSEYGRSKRAAELELQHCRVPFTIVRPPAVYGPRDQGFLPMFKAVNNHLRPIPSSSQALSLVFAPDLATAIVTCLDHPATQGRVYFAASPEVVTGREMAQEIARQMGHWTVPVPLPPALLLPLCVVHELWSHAVRKPMLLNLQKYAELRAPGWVCDASRLKAHTGYSCETGLKAGVAATLDWYQENGWIRC